MSTTTTARVVVKVTAQALTTRTTLQAKFSIPSDISKEVAEAIVRDLDNRPDVGADIVDPGRGERYLRIYAKYGEYEVVTTFSDGTAETRHFAVGMCVEV